MLPEEDILSILRDIKNLLAETLQGEEPRITEFPDMEEEEARSKIFELVSNTKNGIYFSDIVEQLRIPPRLVYEICAELEASGEIKDLDES